MAKKFHFAENVDNVDIKAATEFTTEEVANAKNVEKEFPDAKPKIKELQKNLRAAKRLGRPIKDKKDKKKYSVATYLDEESYDFVVKQANKLDCPVAYYLKRVITKEMKRNKNIAE